MMKNKRTFFGRLLRGAAGSALSAVLFSALPVLKADAAAGSVTLSADGTLTLSGEVTKEQIWAYRDNDAVKAVTAMKGTVLPADCTFLFAVTFTTDPFTTDPIVWHWENLGKIDLTNADTSNVTDMSRMFYCSRVTSLDLSGFDTSNVTDMSSMFCNLCNLTSLDLSSFDTSKVTDMSSMFCCSRVTSLDVSGFDTSKVTDMSSMFDYCPLLTSLDLSSFDTSNVTDMSNMFYDVWSLTSLDLSSFDTSKVTDMSDMFMGCVRMTSLDVSSFDTSKVRDMSSMFYSCENLTSLDLSSFDTSGHPRVKWMFHSCTNLTTIYVSDRWNPQRIGNDGEMFDECISLVGGNGTKYGEGYRSSLYACIDEPDQPGYFTSSFFRSMPKNAYGTIGKNAVFTVKATGKNLKYQWQYNNGHGWRNSTQEGCKTAELSVPAAYYRNGQQYRCVVTDAAGKKHISSAAKMYVILITAQPESVTVAAGKNAVFTVQTAGYHLNYCWQFNNGHGWKNSSMTGCRTASLTVPAAATRNGQRYRCIVTAPNGILGISKEVTMYVK